MTTLLQTVLFPNPKTCGESECYYRQEGDRQVFNTYFNLFSLRKWRTYTDVKDLCLHLESRGKCRLQLIACDHDHRERVLSERELEGEVSENFVFPYSEDDDFLWFSFEKKSNDAELLSASYVTEDAPIHHPVIGIDICTFRREAYVERNLTLLRKTILENSSCPCRDQFQIYVVDNGRTLKKDDIETENGKIHLIPNINAGGSGGFTRGILEILKDKKEQGFTHMIFMDDDAVLEADSLIRTIGLLTYLKEDYKNACIGGAMHRLDFPYIQHEAGSTWNGVTPIRNHEGVDLRDINAVLDNETILKTDYAGWWYACYPLTVVREDNLPLPMFIHCDDIEYGLRNRKNGVILLNGICVWHNSFEHRRSSSLSYHDIRNIMIMNAITYPDGNEKAWVRSLWKRVVGDLFRYRYRDVYLKCSGIADFLKGPAFYMQIDPIAKLQEVNAEGYKLRPVGELTRDPATLAEVENFRFPTELDQIYNRVKVSGREKKLLSFNGMFFPPLEEDHIHAYPMGIDPYSLYRQEEVLLFDPYNKTGIIVRRNVTEMRACLRAFRRELHDLKKNYAAVQRDYCEQINKAKNIDFWKEYLKIDGSGNKGQ
jgi:galactofuranosylgalactofuranosylrhamnosyl-N-acetylglucosaminyl-diphospho-decaprenol beta-1,5/1,6-galactofuranosyltransferase